MPTKLGVAYTKSEDLGDLTKKVTRELRLVPSAVTFIDFVTETYRHHESNRSDGDATGMAQEETLRVEKDGSHR